MLEKYGPNEKNVLYKTDLISNFTIAWENLVQIGSLVKEIQNLGENDVQ